MRKANVVTSGTFLEHVYPAVGLAKTCEGEIWVCADVSSMRKKAGCFLWVVQQSKVVGCCPGVQALTARRCFVITSVDMLAVWQFLLI